jgi:probable F420-dependent oxidoreductase
VAASPDNDGVAGLTVVAGEVRVRAGAGEDPRVPLAGLPTLSDSGQTRSRSRRMLLRMDPRPVTPAAQPGGGRLGVTAAPFIRRGPDAAVDLARRAQRLGYDSFWVAEVTGTEAFSVLGATSVAAPSLGLGTGVLPAQIRTPPLLAMAAASLQALAPDREVLLGIGVSSPVVASDWHGSEYPPRPLAYIREFVALLRQCLSGGVVTFAGDYFHVRKFRLGVELGDRKPKIVLGALGKAMLRLAGEVADGVLLNYLPASHVPWCVEQVRQGGDATVYANVHVGVGDRTASAPHARYDLFSYAVVDAYANSFERAGFGDAVRAIRAAHFAGDRAGALSAVTDEMVSAIDVVGDETLVRDTVNTYRNAGVDVPVVFPLTWGGEAPDALEATLEAAAS